MISLKRLPAWLCLDTFCWLYRQNLLQGAELPVPCYRAGTSFLFQMPVQSCFHNFETVKLKSSSCFFLFESWCRCARAVCKDIPSYFVQFFQTSTQNKVCFTVFFFNFPVVFSAMTETMSKCQFFRYVTCCSFSVDGNWLATGSKDRTLKLWKICLTENGISFSNVSFKELYKNS